MTVSIRRKSGSTAILTSGISANPTKSPYLTGLEKLTISLSFLIFTKHTENYILTIIKKDP